MTIARTDLTFAMADVIDERKRQVIKEGFDTAHDDAYTDNELVRASACFSLYAAGFSKDTLSHLWPRSWSLEWFKDATPRRLLVKAAAPLIAQIEKIDREAGKTS